MYIFERISDAGECRIKFPSNGNLVVSILDQAEWVIQIKKGWPDTLIGQRSIYFSKKLNTKQASLEWLANRLLAEGCAEDDVTASLALANDHLPSVEVADGNFYFN